MNPLSFVRPNILSLEPYSTARDEFKGGDISVWLDANESPYPSGLNRYPDPHQKELKKAISDLKGIAPDHIFIGGAGSDEAIDLTYRIFCRPGIDNAIAIAPSYGVYAVSADINDVELRSVALTEDFSLPVEALLAAADENSRMMWICSPNNPTGNSFSRADILRLADSFNGMVVVDEAYIDFSSEPSLLADIASHHNLIVMQTFSKAWGMASLRMGMAFAVPEIAELYGRVKYPYNVNGPTQAELLRRIAETDIRPQVEEIRQQRDYLTKTLAGLPKVRKVYPSDANFLLVKVDDADAMYSYLTDHGVIVRNRNKVTGCANCLRFTVGTPEENASVVALLEKF
ncbi:histidinol-phosphate transaminase [Duncaniella sp.]|uniref:histidinol-phosphate transaminase n=1 Tax=Duncaniella sp. TaxID=2518496 RepID=UPI0023C29EE0|nr:histidinol-phosphate transaminase [Duncaniella sp.]MDE5905577.1 histidinol-phosphate transaminase [Duncaniella sp.]